MLKAVRTLTKQDVVRGQFRGYLDEPGVAPNSPVETFAAVRFFVDTWRWSDVPFFIRAGKMLPVRATEVVVRLKPPPLGVFDDISPAIRITSVSASRRKMSIGRGPPQGGRRRDDRRTDQGQRGGRSYR